MAARLLLEQLAALPPGTLGSARRLRPPRRGHGPRGGPRARRGDRSGRRARTSSSWPGMASPAGIPGCGWSPSRIWSWRPNCRHPSPAGMPQRRAERPPRMPWVSPRASPSTTGGSSATGWSEPGPARVHAARRPFLPRGVHRCRSPSGVRDGGISRCLGARGAVPPHGTARRSAVRNGDRAPRSR